MSEKAPNFKAMGEAFFVMLKSISEPYISKS